MSSEKRKIAYIDGKPYEIGSNHTSILKFVKSYVGEKKVPTLCDCLLYTSPSPRDGTKSRMPSSA